MVWLECVLMASYSIWYIMWHLLLHLLKYYNYNLQVHAVCHNDHTTITIMIIKWQLHAILWWHSTRDTTDYTLMENPFLLCCREVITGKQKSEQSLLKYSVQQLPRKRYILLDVRFMDHVFRTFLTLILSNIDAELPP
jgi:hypothetical protein